MTGPVGGHVGHENAAANVALLGMRKGGDKRIRGRARVQGKNPVYGDRICAFMTVVRVTTNNLLA